jgi:MFS family permease
MLLLSPVFLFATPKFDCTGMPNFSGTDMSA